MPKRRKALPKNKKKQKADGEVENQGQYWAEAILDWGLHDNGVMMYLVQWEGYAEDENSWEFQQHVMQCEALLTEFHVNHVNGRHPPKWSFDELEKLLQYLKHLVQNEDSKQFQDLAVLKKLCKRYVNCFDIKDNKVIEGLNNDIKQQIHVLEEKKSKLKSRSNAERLDVRDVVASVVQTLNITKNFGSIAQFFEFVDQRVVVRKELNKWEKKQNKVIEREREGRPIKVVNDVDLEKPQLTAYITDYILDVQFGDKIKLEDEEPLVGCKCTDCYDSKDECCTAVIGFPFVHNSRGLLNTNKFNSIIFECNSKCKCDISCPNRQVQRGRRFDLEVFRTDSKIRGWGVRALEVIPKGSYITHYTGEVISILEAEKRPTTYLFDLSTHLDSSDVEFTYVVDASKYGNVTRFINHSCAPNCRVLFAWTKRSTNKLLPIIALFAEKRIRPYEELTYDYSMELIDYCNQTPDLLSNAFDSNSDLSASEDETNDSNPVDSQSSTAHTVRPFRERNERKVRFEKIKCECGAPECQQFLYS